MNTETLLTITISSLFALLFYRIMSIICPPDDFNPKPYRNRRATDYSKLFRNTWFKQYITPVRISRTKRYFRRMTDGIITYTINTNKKRVDFDILYFDTDIESHQHLTRTFDDIFECQTSYLLAADLFSEFSDNLIDSKILNPKH